MTIGRILRDKGSQVFSVNADDTVIAICRSLAQHRIGALLVRDGAGQVVGIVSERDIVRALAAGENGLADKCAAELMTRVMHTVTPATRIIDALAMMTDRRVRHLPVLDEAGQLAGMVSIGDLVKARIAEAEEEASALRDYVTSAG